MAKKLKKVKVEEEVPIEEEPVLELEPEVKLEQDLKVVNTSRGPMYRMPDGRLEPANLD